MAEVRIELITSTTDVPACARLCVTAVSSDPFHTFLDRYGSESFYDSTVTRLMDAINPDNTTDFAFKAVCDITDDNGGIREEIVGVSHWYIGYIKIPKMDPFANKVVGEPNEIGPEEVAIGDETGTLDTGNQSSQVIDTVKKAKVMDEFHRTHGNIYISKIRGKKHVYLRRMMVHPDHQKKGIGRKLLQWGLDMADRQKIVGWLFARPVAAKMYQDAGFQVVAVDEIRGAEGDEPLNVPPGLAMLREPQPYKGGD